VKTEHWAYLKRSGVPTWQVRRRPGDDKPTSTINMPKLFCTPLSWISEEFTAVVVSEGWQEPI